MLIRSLDEILTGSLELQQSFQSRWGRENCILWHRTRHGGFGPCTHTLSIRAAWGGTEYCHVGGRTIGVDDDNFLVLNHGQIYSTSIHSLQPVESLAICFGPQLVEEVYHDSAASIDEALHRGDNLAARSVGFIENLQPHDTLVSPVLRFIRAHLEQGMLDEAWYDEQLILLLGRLKAHHEEVQKQVDSLALLRPSTRRQVYRRIALATDYLHTHYPQEVDLNTLAQIAYLSKYHFLRLFTLVHGTTPHTYLQRKRTHVAVRLLESTQLTVKAVATSVGFADESTLGRQLRRWTQLTPGAIRARGGALTAEAVD